MTRRMVEFAYIVDDSSRKAVYKRRKIGLVKKLKELTTLCGIKACAIIYPHGCGSPLEIWPSKAGVHHLVSELETLPVVSQKSKMVTSESLYQQAFVKANQQLEKQEEENRKNELSRIMFENLFEKSGLRDLNKKDLKDLWMLIQENLEDTDKRLDTLTTTISHWGNRTSILNVHRTMF